MNLKKMVFILLFLSLGFCKVAFCQYIPVPLDTNIKQADFIFEGQFISATPFWGTGIYKGVIYTSCTYKISKLFKGGLKCGNVEIVIVGGTIGNYNQMGSEGPGLSDSGILMCISNGSWPCLHTSKENPDAIGINGMVGYYGNQGISYENTEFSSKLDVYNTFYKALGHRYSACAMQIEPYKLPPVENINKGNSIGNSSSAQENNVLLSNTDKNIELYPNPVINTTTLKIPNNQTVTILIYDDSGKTVFQKENMSGDMLQIDLSGLKPGEYIGKAVNAAGNKVYNFKVSKL